jgi:hypothetical protein
MERLDGLEDPEEVNFHDGDGEPINAGDENGEPGPYDSPRWVLDNIDPKKKIGPWKEFQTIPPKEWIQAGWVVPLCQFVRTVEYEQVGYWELGSQRTYETISSKVTEYALTQGAVVPSPNHDFAVICPEPRKK